MSKSLRQQMVEAYRSWRSAADDYSAMLNCMIEGQLPYDNTALQAKADEMTRLKAAFDLLDSSYSAARKH